MTSELQIGRPLELAEGVGLVGAHEVVPGVPVGPDEDAVLVGVAVGLAKVPGLEVAE